MVAAALGGSTVVCATVVVVVGSAVVIAELGGVPGESVDNGADVAVLVVGVALAATVGVAVMVVVRGAGGVLVLGSDVVSEVCIVSLTATRTILVPGPFCPMYRYPLRSTVREIGFLRRPAAP